MKNRYIIINAETIQKRIEELEILKRIHCYKGSQPNENEFQRFNNEQTTLKQILSNSKPLEEELSKAFDAARERIKHPDWDYIYEESKDYIANLKLDI